MNIANRLNYMRGKSWLYNTREYRVIDTGIFDDTVVISTDKEIIKFDVEDAQKKLTEFTELKGRRQEPDARSPMHEAGEKKQSIELYRQSELANMFDVLIDNIKSVKDNKDYVGQANAINRSIQQVAQLLRLEIDIKKLEMKRGEI